MTYRGHVTNGVVVLDEPADIEDGTVVRVEPVRKQARARQKRVPTLYEQMKPFIGVLKGLPPDLARNHDHYLHGLPKK